MSLTSISSAQIVYISKTSECLKRLVLVDEQRETGVKEIKTTSWLLGNQCLGL